MDLTGYVINAVVVEGRSVAEVAASHDISPSWLYELLARYREQGDDGLKPGSRRPRSSPNQVVSAMEEEIVAAGSSIGDFAAARPCHGGGCTHCGHRFIGLGRSPVSP